MRVHTVETVWHFKNINKKQRATQAPEENYLSFGYTVFWILIGDTINGYLYFAMFTETFMCFRMKKQKNISIKIVY